MSSSTSSSSQLRSALTRWAAVAGLVGIAATSAVASDATRAVVPAALANDTSAPPTGLARVDLPVAVDDVTFDATTLPPVVIPDPGGVDVGMPNQFPDDRISGFDIDTVVVVYDEAADQLAISLVGFGIFGDADGDGDPSSAGSTLTALGGSDFPDFGGEESFAVQLDLDQDGTFDVIAGVPSDLGVGLDGYRLARHSGIAAGAPSFSFAYGPSLAAHDGGTPASPSATSPNLTVVLTDFSQIADTLGLDDRSLDFGVNAFAGSIAAAGIGPDFTPSAGVGVRVVLDAHLGDRVWVDTDLDGVQDADEPGLAGVTVDALDDAGTVVATTTTDSDGGYDLAVRPGTYRVRFSLPSGHSFTERGVGGDAAIDSDADVATGLTTAVTVEQGDEVTDLDAGVIVHEPSVTIEKSTNGDDADDAPGPLLPSGSTATFTYQVTNSGNLDLVDLQVEDDVLGSVCTIASLPIGESEECMATATVRPGDYVNEGTVRGTPTIHGERLAVVTDSDLSHHRGSIDPAVRLEKTTNGVDADDAPGPEIESGTTATFTYTVTNTGNVPLVQIVVTDDQIGFVCQLPSLVVGASASCEEPHTVVPGPYANIGTVTARGSFNGAIVGDVSDTDASHHTGSVVTGIDVEKSTNGLDADVGPGELLQSGSSATFDFVVTNTGNVPLHDVVVTDDVLGTVCTAAIIEVGGTVMCPSASLTVTPGPHVNTATATGTPMLGDVALDPVSDADSSHHQGSLDPAVSIEKLTNGVDADAAPGPTLRTGTLVSWTYVVSNTGNIALTDLEITDDVEGAVCSIIRLEPGEQSTCMLDGTVGVGQYANTAVVTAVPVFGGESLLPVSASDTSHHVGEQPCTPDHYGPLMWAGAIDSWDTGLIAAPGSTIRVLTHEPDSSPGQPHEQVFVFVGGVNLGSTPEGLGLVEFDAGAGGLVEIFHWSVITGDVANPNSVAMAICGSDLS